MAEQRPDLKFGKKPAVEDPKNFRMSKYVDINHWANKLKLYGKDLGHHGKVSERDWGMLANDRYGCCVFASMAHRHQLWCTVGGKRARFSDENVLAAYSAVTGFNPDDPSTDNGTVMGKAALWERQTGITDVHGQRHQCEAYLWIDPGDIIQHYIAIHLFALVDIGFAVPTYCMDQFHSGQPWRIKRAGKGLGIEGYHCVPVTGKKGWLQTVTWGKTQDMSAAFLQEYNDESVVYLESNYLTEGKSPEGFDLATLKADLGKLRR